MSIRASFLSAELGDKWEKEFNTLVDRRRKPSQSSRTAALLYGIGFPFGTTEPIRWVTVNSAVHEAKELKAAFMGCPRRRPMDPRLEAAHETSLAFAAHHLCNLGWKLRALAVACGILEYDGMDWTVPFLSSMAEKGEYIDAIRALNYVQGRIQDLFGISDYQRVRETLREIMGYLGRFAACAGITIEQVVAEEHEKGRTVVTKGRLREYVVRKEGGAVTKASVLLAFIDIPAADCGQILTFVEEKGIGLEHFSYRTLLPNETACIEAWCKAPSSGDFAELVESLRAAQIPGLLHVEGPLSPRLLTSKPVLDYEHIVREVLQEIEAAAIQRTLTVAPSQELLRRLEPEILPIIERAAKRAVRNFCPNGDVQIAPIEREPRTGFVGAPILATLNIPVVFKVGGQELKAQDETMRAYPKDWQKLFPQRLTPIEVSGGKCAMMMEYLGKNELFHLAFSEQCDVAELMRALAYLFDTIDALYRKHRSKSTQPNIRATYIDRIQRRVQFGERRLQNEEGLVSCEGASEFITQTSGSLFQLPVLYEGKLLCPISDCLPTADILERVVGLPDATVVHGDLHLGNIFAIQGKGGYQIRLIDPNEDMRNGDYMYDMGKLAHWLDDLWMVPWEREHPDSSIYRLLQGERDGTLQIQLHLTDPRAAELRKLGQAGERAIREHARRLAEEWHDERWEARYALSRGAAYLGCLQRFEKFHHFLLAFLKGLQALNELASFFK